MCLHFFSFFQKQKPLVLTRNIFLTTWLLGRKLVILTESKKNIYI
uniref:Uncharacterized protein n=1 Tax=Anguilla anguilla TaxID=7936 RepID=A0A0E9UNE2_ANGAN